MQPQAETDARILSAFDFIITPLADTLGGKQLANRLGQTRIALGVVVTCLAWWGGFTDSPAGMWANLIATLLFIVGGWTDLVDGPVARVYKSVGPEGKFLDQLADKVLMLPLLAVGVVWTSRVQTHDYHEYSLVWVLAIAAYWSYSALSGSRILQDLVSMWFYWRMPGLGSNDAGKNKTHYDMAACFYILCVMTAYHFLSFDTILVMTPPSIYLLSRSFLLANQSLASKRRIYLELVAEVE